MPLLTVCKTGSSVSYCVWRILETEDFFWQSLRLSPDDAQAIRELRSPMRRLERMACRMALSHLLDSPVVSVRYDAYGAPHIAGRYISFSHCKTHVAVALAPYPVGIDIEPVTSRILELHAHFVNECERKCCDVTDARQLHLCWSAKEAMYKCVPNAPANFKQAMTVLPTAQPNELSGTIQMDNGLIDLHLYHKELDGLMLVWCERT